MIYSIVPNEVIFQNSQDTIKARKVISYNGRMLEVYDNGNGEGVIERVLSTNLSDFLSPQYQIGCMVRLF